MAELTTYELQTLSDIKRAEGSMEMHDDLDTCKNLEELGLISGVPAWGGYINPHITPRGESYLSDVANAARDERALNRRATLDKWIVPIVTGSVLLLIGYLIGKFL